MNEDEKMLISVFSTNNNAVFQVAKSILDNNRIKFFSNGDYLNTLNPAAYSAEIKVFKKNEKAARELLSELAPTSSDLSNEFENKKLTQRGYWYIAIILLSLIIMIVAFAIFKK